MIEWTKGFLEGNGKKSMKLLATDYDGTLCYGYGEVMPEDLEAIARWKKREICSRW